MTPEPPDDELADALARLGRDLTPGSGFTEEVLARIADLPETVPPSALSAWLVRVGPWLYVAAQVLIFVFAGTADRQPPPDPAVVTHVREFFPELTRREAERLAGRSGPAPAPWLPTVSRL